MKTFLLTDGEFTGLIRTLRSLREEVRIVGFCSDLSCAHSAMLDQTYVSPCWDSKEYYSYLKQIIEMEKVDYVFPVGTLSLDWFAEKKESLEAETKAVILTPSAETIERSNDKGWLFAFLKDKGMKECLAEFTLADNKKELQNAFKAFEAREIDCICKPARGENAEGFFRYTTDEAYARALFEGNAAHMLCEYQLAMLDDNMKFAIPKIVMPYLPGKEWDVDVLAWKGKIKAITLRVNDDMFGGLSASSSTRENEKLHRICSQIMDLLSYTGLACLSFKEDAGGNPKLLEINPRAMGSIHLSTLAGNNLVEQYLELIESEANPTDDMHMENAQETVKITPAGFSTALYYDIVPVRKEEVCWKRLGIEDKEIYEEYFKKMRTHIADLTFNCHFAWDNVFHNEWAIMEDCFVQISYCDPENAFVLMPFGEYDAPKLTRIMTLVREEFRRRNIPFRIACIDEAYLDIFKDLSLPHGELDYDEDYADYLYDAELLRTLAGRKMSKKRNHLHRFQKLYPDYEYTSLTRENLKDCLDCVKRWAINKEADLLDTDESDYTMIGRIFDHWDLLQVKGGLIRIDGKIAAFSIGSQVGHTAYIHFEKGDIAYDGVYAAINQMVLINEFPEVQYVNREEDLGVPNLRKSKESYHPIRKVPKYRLPVLT